MNTSVKVLVSLLTAIVTQAAVSAEISGYLMDEGGHRLKGARVCLSLASDGPEDCVKRQFTNANGEFSFKGVKENDRYLVRVLADASVKGRKENPYPNYVWKPVKYSVDVFDRKDSVTDLNFTGAFNFSNFQTELQLTEQDFPELGFFDFSADKVFLKVFSDNPDPQQQRVIYLGQVYSATGLLIEASLPLTVKTLNYEIYSADQGLPVHGSIAISN